MRLNVPNVRVRPLLLNRAVAKAAGEPFQFTGTLNEVLRLYCLFVWPFCLVVHYLLGFCLVVHCLFVHFVCRFLKLCMFTLFVFSSCLFVHLICSFCLYNETRWGAGRLLWVCHATSRRGIACRVRPRKSLDITGEKREDRGCEGEREGFEKRN